MIRPKILDDRRTEAVIAAALILKILVLFIMAWNRRFVMDEFAQLGWARYLGREMFDTVWPAKSVGFQIFIKPAHVPGWDARSILLIGRMQMVLLACATLAVVFASARRLGQSKLSSALIVLTTLSFSNFIERVIETRAEPLALFFGAAALLLCLGSGEARRHFFAAGVVSGLAFLATQKAIYFNLALGIALVGASLQRRRFVEGVERGGMLVLGWCTSIAFYCFLFGGSQPSAILNHLIFGPTAVMSPQVAASYGGLRGYVLQTLADNILLYLLCFSGMILTLLRVRQLEARTVIALIFSAIVTVFVFAHDQPWPYVFIMALPFISLWAMAPLDQIHRKPGYSKIILPLFAVGIVVSFGRNIALLQIHNRDQLALVEAAERLTGPNDVYFDGIGMLPNRREPSTVWLDRFTILQTLRDGRNSEALRSLRSNPPKVILWSYRLDAIRPLMLPIIRSSYVRIAPNIWIAGRKLRRGEAVPFDAPVAGTYALYDSAGRPVAGQVQVNGSPAGPQVDLPRGSITIRMTGRPPEVYLLPVGSYEGLITHGKDDDELFAAVYD